jgi:hypothetical protein
VVAWGLVVVSGTAAWAQRPAAFVGDNGLYHPLHQRMPAGQAAYMKNVGNLPAPPYYQPFQILLPTTGSVTVYHSGPQSVDFASGGQAGLLVGHLYRLRVANMPEVPGVELYPTVEVLDRLHPPPGRETAFPIPVQLTLDEVETAAAGGMVTKVVYLEQPNVAAPRSFPTPLPTQTLPPSANALGEADRVGRPLAIVRVGGRMPIGPVPEPGFYGTGAPAVALRGPEVQNTDR